METKGTAMSFGFKKKIPTQKRNTDGAKLKNTNKNDLNTINANNLKTDNACCIGDNNGNSGNFENSHNFSIFFLKNVKILKICGFYFQ